MRAVAATTCPPAAPVHINSRRRRCVSRPASRQPLSTTTSTAKETSGRAFENDPNRQQVPFRDMLPRQAVAMFAAGAALGPFCDGLHSQNNVLHYVNPTVSIHLDSIHWSFETCWWVPLLFGVAGLILGVSVPVLDKLAAPKVEQQLQQQVGQEPSVGQGSPGSRPSPPSSSSSAAGSWPMRMQAASWPWVLLCISLFVAQYWLSGVLERPLLDKTLVSGSVPALDAVLCCYALLHWAVFDSSVQGLAMSALTAVCGPAIEVVLINAGGLYHYTHPVLWQAVPSWIPWVYFCGGPAVGNLGRIVWRSLELQLAKSAPVQQEHR